MTWRALATTRRVAPAGGRRLLPPVRAGTEQNGKVSDRDVPQGQNVLFRLLFRYFRFARRGFLLSPMPRRAAGGSGYVRRRRALGVGLRATDATGNGRRCERLSPGATEHHKIFETSRGDFKSPLWPAILGRAARPWRGGSRRGRPDRHGPGAHATMTSNAGPWRVAARLPARISKKKL